MIQDNSQENYPQITLMDKRVKCVDKMEVHNIHSHSFCHEVYTVNLHSFKNCALAQTCDFFATEERQSTASPRQPEHCYRESLCKQNSMWLSCSLYHEMEDFNNTQYFGILDVKFHVLQAVKFLNTGFCHKDPICCSYQWKYQNKSETWFICSNCIMVLRRLVSYLGIVTVQRSSEKKVNYGILNSVFNKQKLSKNWSMMT